jgi:hypothetical protein
VSAAARSDADLPVGEPLPEQDEVARRKQFLVPVGGEEGIRVADRLRLIPSEHAGGGGIPHPHRSVGAADDHRQGRRLDQRVQDAAGLVECLLGARSLGEVVLDGIEHEVVRPHQRGDLVLPGNGVEVRSGIFPDGLTRFIVQAVQRQDEQEDEAGPDQSDADHQDDPPLGHLGPVLRQEFLDDADIGLDQEAELFVHDVYWHISVRTV